MKNKLKGLFILSSTLITPLFVAAQCSPSATPVEDKKPVEETPTTPAPTSESSESTGESNSTQTTPASNSGATASSGDNNSNNNSNETPSSNTGDNSTSPSTNSENNSSQPAEQPEEGNTTTLYGRLQWDASVTKEDFLKELKKVSLEYTERSRNAEQIRTLSRFFIADKRENLFTPTADNLAVKLRVRRIKSTTNEDGTTSRKAEFTVVDVPFTYHLPEDIDSTLTVSQKNAKNDLLKLRELAIKTLFVKVDETAANAAYYDLNQRLVNDFQLYATLFLSVSRFMLTIDYLLDNRIFDSHLNLILKGQDVKDSTGEPNEKETEKFFNSQWNLYPSTDNPIPYSFAFTYLFLIKRYTELSHRASQSS